MTVRVGCTLVPWAAVSAEQAFEAVVRAGFAGVEIGTLLVAYPGPPGALHALLEESGLVPAAGEFSAWFFDRSRLRDELEEMRRVLDALAALECGTMVLSAATVAERLRVAGQPASIAGEWLTRDQLRYMADALNRAGDISRDFGVLAAFRNRVGSFVETRAELELIAEHTEPELLGLAPDAAHLVYGGMAPEELAGLFRAHATRITYWPVQDVDLAVVARARRERLPFAAAEEAGAFVQLGEGELDFGAQAEPLRSAQFDGWVTWALEHPGQSPADAARAARDYIGEKLGW